MPHENDIGFQLHNLSYLLKRYFERSFASLHMDDNVSRNNLWILGYLAHNSHKDIFQKDIENTFCVRRSTVSKVLRLMEEKGFIRRIDVDYDARLKKIVLTDSGKAVHDMMLHERNVAEQILRQNVTNEELEIFFNVMEKFKSNINHTL